MAMQAFFLIESIEWNEPELVKKEGNKLKFPDCISDIWLYSFMDSSMQMKRAHPNSNVWNLIKRKSRSFDLRDWKFN